MSNQAAHDIAIDREGITSLAAWQTLDPEALIYRKFGYLSARRSVYLQNRLLELEHHLEGLDTQIRKGGVDAKKSFRKHEIFAERAAVDGSLEEQQSDLLDEIDKMLNQYHDSLLKQAEIVKLGRPRPRAIKAFKSFFLSSSPEKRLLYGKAQHLLDDEQDLVALYTPADIDPLSTVLQDRWPQMSARRRARQGATTLFFSELKVQRVVAFINIIVASVLIIGAIVGLYNLRSQPDPIRLGSIAAFTALFSISLWLLTNAKRAEIFAATAAYAAVLVVFVSGDLGTSTSATS